MFMKLFCISVLNVAEKCKSMSKVSISNPSGYISPTSVATSGSCPVDISIPSGQLLKFSLNNFLKKSGSACYEVAVIKEKDKQKSIHVCQSDPRTKEVMMTSSSHVTVHFSDFQIGESVGSFLLHYEGNHIYYYQTLNNLLYHVVRAELSNRQCRHVPRAPSKRGAPKKQKKKKKNQQAKKSKLSEKKNFQLPHICKQ